MEAAGEGIITRQSGHIVGQHLEGARGCGHKRNGGQSGTKNVHLLEELHLEQLEAALLGGRFCTACFACIYMDS
jgi:hypothetical protein